MFHKSSDCGRSTNDSGGKRTVHVAVGGSLCERPQDAIKNTVGEPKFNFATIEQSTETLPITPAGLFMHTADTHAFAAKDANADWLMNGGQQ